VYIVYGAIRIPTTWFYPPVSRVSTFYLFIKQYFYKSSTFIYCCLSTIRRVWVLYNSTIIVDLHNFLWNVAIVLQWTFKIFMIEYWFYFISELVYFKIFRNSSHFKCRLPYFFQLQYFSATHHLVTLIILILGETRCASACRSSNT